MEFSSPTRVLAVATKGRPNFNEWVTSYSLYYRDWPKDDTLVTYDPVWDYDLNQVKVSANEGNVYTCTSRLEGTVN